MTTRDTDWDGVRLHVVTGKGGTGKTTVAAAMALALATAGRKVLLIEVEGRQGIARLFDCPPLPYDERKVALGLGGRDRGRRRVRAGRGPGRRAARLPGDVLQHAARRARR